MAGVLRLSVSDREALERIARSGTEPRRRVVRVEALVELAGGAWGGRWRGIQGRIKTRCGAGGIVAWGRV